MRYEIAGESTPVAICQLDQGEAMIAESGSMVWMSSNMEMTTRTGGFGRTISRMISGENFFINRFSPNFGWGTVAFASSFPGRIVPLQITPDHPVIVQKTAFLASEDSIKLSVFFQKRLSSGLFGGEGFLMQKLEGNGLAFIEIDGFAKEYQLAADETIIVNTGNLAMMDATCTLSIKTVEGVGNMLFGGHGLFHAVVKGPGNVVVQSMTISNLAHLLSRHMPAPPRQQNSQ